MTPLTFWTENLQPVPHQGQSHVSSFMIYHSIQVIMRKDIHTYNTYTYGQMQPTAMTLPHSIGAVNYTMSSRN